MAVLTLAEAKSHLNLTASTHDAELLSFIIAAEAAIGERVGPLSTVVTTVRIRGGRAALRLPVAPAVSLTSVTPYEDSALTLADLYLDGAAGLVTHNDGTSFTASHYTVVYTAGRSTCPADLLLAVKELVRHLWETQRGPTARPGSNVSDSVSNTIPGAAYIFPHRVSQLLKPHTPILVGV